MFFTILLTIIDDGYLYTTFTSVECDRGNCKCNEEGGIQQRLSPLAYACLFAYSFGFPAFVLSRLLLHRRKILEDQYLRAYDIGDSRESNPRAYEIRKLYHKLYYHFKPEQTYWIVLIIGRKFWIAFAGLMFRGNASFQLATVLLVLFAR